MFGKYQYNQDMLRLILKVGEGEDFKEAIKKHKKAWIQGFNRYIDDLPEEYYRKIARVDEYERYIIDLYSGEYFKNKIIELEKEKK